MIKLRLFVAVFACFLFVFQTAAAQEFGRADEIRAEGTAYYIYTRPGEATIQILVVGSIGSPGIYEVSMGTDLLELFTLARGSIAGTTTIDAKQTLTLRLFRIQGDTRVQIFQATGEDILNNTNPYPELQEGDLLTIETIAKQRFTWRTALQFVTTISVLVLTIDRLTDVF